MFCEKCEKKAGNNDKFCTTCGSSLSDIAGKETEAEMPDTVTSTVSENGPTISTGKIIKAVIIIAIVIFVGYVGTYDDADLKNNQGIASFESGDNQAAISQLQEASQEAIPVDSKVNSLKNLGYVYATEGRYEEALVPFQEALELSENATFDYYLISGEIALLEYEFSKAHSSLGKAYQLEPDDFQVNNSLALFYLDLEEVAPQYEDYVKALFHANKAFEGDVEKSEIAKQNLAIAHLFNENYDDTVDLLSTTNLEQHPYMSYWLGLAYIAKGDELFARYYLQLAVDSGIELEPELSEYLYL